MKIFCIIPAYNEEKNIFNTVEGVKSFFNDVVVIDDGSSDVTGQMAREAGAIVLTHIINRGQGAALETGNQYAFLHGADIVVHFDADGQFLAEEIAEVIAPIIAREAEIVLGSRFLEKRSNMPLFKRRVIIPLAYLFNRVFLKIKTSDPQCGFRAFSRDAVLEFSIKNDGMAHCSEILAKASASSLKLKEVPVTVVYHRFGQKLSGGFRIIFDLFLSKIVN